MALAVVAVAPLIGFSLPASASLGGNVSSVESDRAQMNASVQVMQHDTYEVHEMQAPGGTVVDEYVSPAGHGVCRHLARPVSSSHAADFGNVLSAVLRGFAGGSRRSQKCTGIVPLNIQQQGLVVQTGGHMRAHSGRAYDPNLLPQGFTVDEIQ